MQVTKRNGKKEDFDIQKIRRAIEWASQGLDVDTLEIETNANVRLTDGISTAKIHESMIQSAAELNSVQKQDYTKAAARMLLQVILKEVEPNSEIQSYPSLRKAIEIGVDEGIINDLLEDDFDLDLLQEALVPERDFEFDYLGLKTLYDRYFLRHRPKEGESGSTKIFEAPQIFWMRVAMGLALAEDDEVKDEKAIEFYNLLSTFKFVSSTPTLFNSGTVSSQLSSCFLTQVNDSIWEWNEDSDTGKGIFATITDCALLSKYAGGLGIDWTYVRPAGSPIQGTNGVSSGVIPFITVANNTSIAVNQAGKRQGSFACYLEPWHGDIERFIDLRRAKGDERLRAREIFTALWVPDLFMKRVDRQGTWSLFDSGLYPELHELYGKEFEERYEELEAEGKYIKQVSAEELWKKIVTASVESGGPWICFKDEANRRNAQSHIGTIVSSNLCCMTEDQRIVTDKGIVTVKELYDTQERVKVAGRDGAISNASEMLLPRPDAPIVKIVTDEGYEHKVTPDHRVWVKDKGWVEAQNLAKGDLLEIQHTPIFGTVDKPKLAFLAGMIAGDGTYGPSAVCIDVWHPKTSYLKEEIEEAVEEVISSEFRQVRMKLAADGSRAGSKSSLVPKFSGNENKFRLSSGALAIILEDEGFTRETKLSIPEFVWKGTRETMAQYIRGLYLSDGTTQGTGEVCIASIASISRSLLKDLQILLANFGIKSSLTFHQSKGERMMPDGKGGEASYFCQDSWRLLITSIKGCKILESITGIGEARGNELYLSRLQKEGYAQKMTARFSHLEKLPNEDAYCLRVDSSDHAWTANGLITHNTEIELISNDSEIAVCNLGSINLSRVSVEEFSTVIPTAVRMLDNVIDINFYPVDKAKNSNMRHRPIGLGVMGWEEHLAKSGIDFESHDHLVETNRVFQAWSYEAIKASADLAMERGPYSSFSGSKWSRGILPIDTARDLGEFGITDDYKEKWDKLRDQIKEHGIRNSNVMAIAPTATIANIAGTTPSIEPSNDSEFVKENKSGKFAVVNPALKHAKTRKTAFEIDQLWIVRAAAIRQMFIDQSQSVNLFKRADTKGSVITSWYFNAWRLGLKTTYYLRQQIKTVNHAEVGAPEPQACSIDNPDCESCQ
jgi:ribonucleoside-diphosphate reductase alpha chain